MYMKYPTKLVILSSIFLALASCSQKQFSFREVVKVNKTTATPLTTIHPEQSVISIPTITSNTVASPVSAKASARITHINYPSTQTRVKQTIKYKSKTVYTFPTDSISTGKTVDPNQHNDTALAIMGIVAGVFGIVAFGLILGGTAIALGIITLRMAEARGKSRTLPLIALALGLFDVFFTLVFISTVL